MRANGRVQRERTAQYVERALKQPRISLRCRDGAHRKLAAVKQVVSHPTHAPQNERGVALALAAGGVFPVERLVDHDLLVRRLGDEVLAGGFKRIARDAAPLDRKSTRL